MQILYSESASKIESNDVPVFEVDQSQAKFVAQSSILRASARCSQTLSSTNMIDDISESYIMKTTRTFSSNATYMRKNNAAPVTEEYWLWSAVTAFNEIDKQLLSLNEFQSFTPCGGVCFGLDKKCDDQYNIRTDIKGLVYCFLPTSMESLLPFHINGCFALSTDRRRLLQKFVDDRNKRQYEWNDLILKAVSKALLLGLENALNVCGPHSFETLTKFWSIPIKLPSLKALETTFLSSIIDPLKNFATLSDGKQVGYFQLCWIPK
ncbi:unnamed protein product [Didymodactylos carnosus]|uniref:Uncharacterized protein n=1 Tax=Didymodactylos carnosus TaxID=1234261 RepID=A0A8S2KS49_9BILA|nr:unnamed protein product [Didymodactylos carnosus]CAF3866952.1 unnamed protein product [Didymodactylos carnosus]